MTKVLMLGFSVTEMVSSYVPRLKSLAATRGADLEIDHCGIGGITTEGLPYFVDRVIADKPDADRIVFEITTSYVRDVYRKHLQFDQRYGKIIWSHIASLILKTRSAGRDVAFVNLPRGDVDYEADFLEATIAQVCAGYNVPVLSIGTELMLRSVPIDSVLMDGIHPSPVGAELYAERILDFLVSLGPARRIPALSVSPFRSVAIKSAASGELVRFERHGFHEDYVELNGGESITIKLDRPSHIEGIAVLVGAKSGWLTFDTDIQTTLLFFDEHCYYQRMMTTVQPLGFSDTIKVSLSPEIPPIELLKGKMDSGPRKVGLFYLFYQE